MKTDKSDLASIMRRLRSERNWTLKQMSECVGITISTLSKIERGKLTLSFDKLQQLSERLGMQLSELVATGPQSSPVDEKVVPLRQVMGRRSLSSMEDAMHITTSNYDYYFLSADLRSKQMVPLITKVQARSLEEFGEMTRHRGEEFVYALKGSVKVVTEFYSDFILKCGESMYFDSSMGHAFLVAPDCDEALLLSVSTASHEEMAEMMSAQAVR
jgi:transcriptional regulator with XRE-family HTH domain